MARRVAGHRTKKSRYDEDVFIYGHTTVWGSFYDKEKDKWGYACCRRMERDVGCGPAEPEPVADAEPELAEEGKVEEAAPEGLVKEPIFPSRARLEAFHVSTCKAESVQGRKKPSWNYFNVNSSSRKSQKTVAAMKLMNTSSVSFNTAKHDPFNTAKHNPFNTANQNHALSRWPFLPCHG